MTQEQLDYIQSVISEFRGHRLRKASDARLISNEIKCEWTIDRVRELHEIYMVKRNLKTVSSETGISVKRLKEVFDRYNLQKFGVNGCIRGPKVNVGEEILNKRNDTLTMNQSEWNKKWDITSKGLYYKMKKLALRDHDTRTT